MTLRAVFIDVGNTLLYEDPSRFRIYAQAAEKRGLKVCEGPSSSTDRMRDLMGQAHNEVPVRAVPGFRYGAAWFREFIRRIYHGELGLPEAELPALEEELFAHFDDPNSYRVREGAVEILSNLARREDLAMGVISNGTDRLPALLAALGLANHFDFVISSALLGFEKPDPAIFEEALRRAQVHPGEAVHIGDDWKNDVLGARQVGLQTVLFDPAPPTSSDRPSYDPEALAADPTLSRVESFAELGKDLAKRISSGSPPPSS